METEPALHLWAVSSGWDGPFQREETLVAAASLDEAVRLAEEAFDGVAQPVCRAKMRAADLGPLRAGAIGPPRVAGAGYAAAGAPVDLRCGPPAP
jgi:hypothetical protein